MAVIVAYTKVRIFLPKQAGGVSSITVSESPDTILLRERL